MMNGPKGGVAVVLISGGIDSSTCLYIARELSLSGKYRWVEGLSIDYGQRHHREINAAINVCRKAGVDHTAVNHRGIFPNTMLTDPDAPVPSLSYDEIQGVSPTYVPYRNGTLLSLATAHLVGLIKEYDIEVGPNGENESGLFFGAHAEDSANWAYPDCTPEFNGAMANAIYVGTYKSVRLHVPLQWMTKREIITKGTELNVPWNLTWSCYKGEELQCGVCPTCRARKDGFAQAGVTDPTMYADELVAEAKEQSDNDDDGYITGPRAVDEDGVPF